MNVRPNITECSPEQVLALRHESPEGCSGNVRPPRTRPVPSTSSSTPPSRAGAREAARHLFATHAISPRVAAAVGVTLDDRGLVFPNGRRRLLVGDGPKMLNPKGKPLAAWWLREAAGPPVVCEGETDALAALSALKGAPKRIGFRGLAVVSVPGASYPAARLVEELRGRPEAWLIGDGDDAGRRFATKASAALIDAGIRPIVVELPEGTDLADHLVAMPAAERGDRFAHLLADWQIAAPTMADHRRERRIARLEVEVDRLKAERPPLFVIRGGAA